MIKTLDVSLGRVGAVSLLDPPTIGVPVIEPGVVLASGYYIEQTSGQLYYYDAVNDQWYYYAAGYIYPLSISWIASPSAKIDLVAGDTLRFNLSFKYMGPQVTRTFYAAVGDDHDPGYTGSFAEWTDWNAEKDITIPEHETPTLITGKYVDLVVPSGSAFWDHEGEDGAAYCKIMNGFTLTEGENCTPYYCHVCHSVPAVGEVTEFGITKFEKV